MEGLWKNKYDLFVQELADVLSSGLFNETSIGECLQICNRMLIEIKSEAGTVFNEPWFQRNVYPYFLAEAEYLKYIACLQLFCPTEKDKERNVFINREKQRLEKFEHLHHSFLNYYQSGASEQDEFYFSSSSSQYPTILAGWFALKKYSHYICLIH